MKSNWRIYQSIESGANHDQLHQISQDRVCSESSDGKIALCLLDGTGTKDVIAVSNEKIARKVCRFMIKMFDAIYSGRNLDEIRYELIREIYQVINEVSGEYHISTHELASTCVAVVVEEETNRYCTIHLGDGIICFKEQERIRPVSKPVNGRNKNETWLTLSPYVLNHIKISQGNLDDQVTDIILTSDGVYSEVDYTNIMSEIKSIYDKIKITGRYPCKKKDDQGLIALSRKE